MKIKIIKDSTVTETEITVKCAAVDENLKRLLDELEYNNAIRPVLLNLLVPVLQTLWYSLTVRFTVNIQLIIQHLL